jgi:hypothetical protein
LVFQRLPRHDTLHPRHGIAEVGWEETLKSEGVAGIPSLSLRFQQGTLVQLMEEVGGARRIRYLAADSQFVEFLSSTRLVIPPGDTSGKFSVRDVWARIPALAETYVQTFAALPSCRPIHLYANKSLDRSLVTVIPYHGELPAADDLQARFLVDPSSEIVEGPLSVQALSFVAENYDRFVKRDTKGLSFEIAHTLNDDLYRTLVCIQPDSLGRCYFVEPMKGKTAFPELGMLFIVAFINGMMVCGTLPHIGNNWSAAKRATLPSR